MEIKSEQLWSVVKPRLRVFIAETWNFGLVATMTGSTVPTVSGWLADQVPPGERLIKLWHMLAAVGQESPELDELPAFNRYCGELLAFGVVDIKDLQGVCNLANPQGVLSMLRGTPPMRPQFSVHDLQELYGTQLNTVRSELPLLTQVSEPTMDQTGANPLIDVTLIQRDPVLPAAVLLNAALPLVRYLDDEGSPAQRASLRSLMGEEGMFNLSNHFYNLCGERARANRK